ncbi:MAG: hypothetical protein ABH860_01195 [bacterium]
MLSKPFYVIFVFSAFCVSLILPSYSADFSDRFAVSPPAVWSGSNTNGTARTITGVLPSDFKENGEIVTVDGSYSNRVFCRGQNLRQYRASIRLNGDLISGVNTIPAANLKYMLTYTNGIGTVYNYQKYVDFSTAPNTVYLSGPVTIESPSPEQDSAERELQFKYAVQVPNDQLPGTYTANIEYSGEEIGGTSVTRTAQISVTVGNYFRLSVDRSSIDFEKMKPGDVKDNVPVEGVIVTSKTNTGNHWYLKISNDSPLSSGPYVIPNSNFIWHGWTDGAGVWCGDGTNQMTFVPELVYSSGITEGNNLPNGTNNHLKFKLSIPKGQPGGKYLSTVKLTMTE